MEEVKGRRESGIAPTDQASRNELPKELDNLPSDSESPPVWIKCELDCRSYNSDLYLYDHDLQ